MLRWTFILSASCLLSMTSAILGLDDIYNAVKNLPSTVQEVPNIATNLVDLISSLTGGIINVGDVGEDIQDLANTLSVCIDDLTQLFPAAVPIDEIISIDVDIDLFGIDFDNLPFILVAATLLPLKSEIEDVCIDKVPNLIQGVRRLIPGSSSSPTSSPVTPPPGTGGFLFGGPSFVDLFNSAQSDTASRRLFTNDGCEDGAFCNPASATYPMQETNRFNYQVMVGFLQGLGMITDSNQPVTADTLQGWRGGQLTVNIILEIITQVCATVQTCTPPDKILTCKTKVGVCGKVSRVWKWTKVLFDYAVASASYHNTRITNVKIGTIFKDRLNIIHNQFRIRDHVTTKYDDRTDYLDDEFGDAATDRTNKYNARSTDLNSKYSSRSTYLDVNFSAADDDRDGKYSNRTIYLDAKVGSAVTDRQTKYDDRTEYLDEAFLDSTNDRQKKFENRTRHLNHEFDTASDDRQDKFDALTLDLQIKYDSLTNNIRVLNDTVNSLPNLNGAASENGNGGGNGNGNSRANSRNGLVLDVPKQTGGDEGDRLITINMTTTHLYIIGGTIFGMNVLIIILAVVLMFKCCNGRKSGYSRVQKYETESEMEIK